MASMAQVNAAPAGAVEEWRAHWAVVLAATAATTLPIVHLYSTGVMMPSLEAEFGWSRAEISSGPAIVSVVIVLLAPLIGIAVDRFGPRRIGLIGGAAFCASLALLATTGASLWQWWGLWVLLAVAAAAVNPAIWATAVSSLFDRSRGLALAVTLTGTGIGAILVPIVATWLVGAYGWRLAYAGLGLGWAVVILPLLLLFFYGQSDKARTGRAVATAKAPDAAPAGHIMRSARYLKLATAATAITAVSSGVVINFVPILRAGSWDAQTAAGIASLAGIGSIAGRLTGGLLLDRINGNLVGAAAAFILVAAVTLLFALPPSLPVAMAAVILAGLTVGVEYDAVAYLTARHFGTASFGTLFGTITGLLALAGGIGPFVVNAMFDRFGTYAAAWWTLVPVGLVAGALFLTLGPYPGKAEDDASQ